MAQVLTHANFVKANFTIYEKLRVTLLIGQPGVEDIHWAQQVQDPGAAVHVPGAVKQVFRGQVAVGCSLIAPEPPDPPQSPHDH